MQPIGSPAPEPVQTEHELDWSHSGMATRKRQIHAKTSTRSLNQHGRGTQQPQTLRIWQAHAEGAKASASFLQPYPDAGASQEERQVRSSLLRSSINKSKDLEGWRH